MHRIRVAEGLSCLDHIASTFQEVLAERHEVVLFPADYYTVAPAVRREMAERLVQSCDVILSQADGPLVGARARLDAPVPLCMLLMGSLPRGFSDLQWLDEYLRASDVLVANCSADVAIAAALVENACVRRLPFAYREQVFYPPSAREAAAMRDPLGIPADAPVVLYAGRHTLEKNVHTVLKVFAMVRAAVPDAHLVLAGPVTNVESRSTEFFRWTCPPSCTGSWRGWA